jgi:hypothetical protein
MPSIDFKSSLADARLRYSQISNQSSRTVTQPSTSDPSDRARLDGEKARLDGTTESTLSTTSPSTVWDELDDLKSRIRKLELTGKLPASSAAAMSSASSERPRTAATTATTLSSSPKQKHVRKSSSSPEAPSCAVTAASVQTLLQSALAKAKNAVGSEVYNALEATATDALTLTNMLASTSTTTISSNSSSATGIGMSERQAKRKADSLCRGLTEVCLALTEGQTATQPSSQPQQPQEQTRPRSRHQKILAGDVSDAVSTNTTRYRRRMSHEPETAAQHDSGVQTHNRFDNQRANTIHLGSSTVRRERLSHDETASSPHTPSLAAPTSRLHRLSGSHRIMREDNSNERVSIFSRTMTSRAATEVDGHNTESPSSRYSTSHSQQPKGTPLLSSSLAQRRMFATPLSAGNVIPTASSLKIQPGSRRYGGSAALGYSDRGASEPPSGKSDTISPSQGLHHTRISVPSSKTASSYTAIQQPRLRNETIGSRRLLRTRPSTVGQNNDH